MVQATVRIVYLPLEKGGARDFGTYEHARARIDEAKEQGIISQEVKEGLIGRLNHIRNISLIEARNREREYLIGGTGDATQDANGLPDNFYDI